MLKVYYHHPEKHAQNSDYLRSLLHENIELLVGDDVDEFDIIIGAQFTDEVLERSARLKHILMPWVGVRPDLITQLQKFPHLTLHNCHWSGDIIAEFMIGMLFTAAKNIIPPDRDMRRGDWGVWDSPAVQLRGKHALVLGYGSIGKKVAQLARMIGMTVSVLRRSVSEAYEEDGLTIQPRAALHALLPSADCLLITLPLTAETEGLIGEAELALMHEHSILVNVGRGKIVDEKALYEALRDRQIHSAALDVWYNYPSGDAARPMTFPSNYPIHQLDNVVMSPHHSAAVIDQEHDRARARELARLLNVAAEGQPLPSQVDMSLGY
ncbi:MAG: NAD(P)-dependent oxidoreductase [Candidatus Promineifilaceae bacterium]